MKGKTFLVISCVVLMSVLAASASMAAPCGECHKEWSDKVGAQKVLHSPFEEADCEVCHEDHGDTNKLTLVEDGNALCYQCHDEPGEGSRVHAAVEDEGCLGCHSPHGSGNRALLLEVPEDLCIGCHDDPTSRSVKHEAALDGGCVDCHDPHSSKNRPLLLKAVPDLCAECHDGLMEGKLHTIIEEDGCQACHDPHSSDSARLLSGPAEGLCQECHGTMVEKGPVVHEAVSGGTCTDCHTPHASKHRPLLLSDQPALCGECHEIFGEYDKLIHTAITDGACTDCHGPHESSEAKLLRAPYNTERYPGAFKPDKFSLCFECHDPSLVTGKGEDGVTNFRDGDTNLHDIHVQGELKPNKYGIVMRGKARSCAGCHNPHGSSQPHNLVRDYECASVLCYSMTFYPLEDGGKCAVGCHIPRSYHREGSAVTEPQAAN
ncbi:MAG: hypothetical protein JSV70_02605 [bacterium]|nr:MAG: hypothetical protein JSV70_02605 [bacterium]